MPVFETVIKSNSRSGAEINNLAVNLRGGNSRGGKVDVVDKIGGKGYARLGDCLAGGHPVGNKFVGVVYAVAGGLPVGVCVGCTGDIDKVSGVVAALDEVVLGACGKDKLKKLAARSLVHSERAKALATEEVKLKGIGIVCNNLTAVNNYVCGQKGVYVVTYGEEVKPGGGKLASDIEGAVVVGYICGEGAVGNAVELNEGLLLCCTVSSVEGYVIKVEVDGGIIFDLGVMTEEDEARALGLDGTVLEGPVSVVVTVAAAVVGGSLGSEEKGTVGGLAGYHCVTVHINDKINVRSDTVGAG